VDGHGRATFALAVLGCRANQEESEAIRSHLTALGGDEIGFPGPADLVVVNTCAVTATALAQSRQAIRRAARLGGPGSWILAMGCGAQLDPRGLAALPQVGLVLGNAAKLKVPALLRGLFPGSFPPEQARLRAALAAAGLAAGGGEEAEAAPVQAGEPAAGSPICWQAEAAGEGFLSRAAGVSARRARGLLKIQDGCDRACSYCVVASLRGRPRSRPRGEVLGEVRRLVAEGCREIVLTGINLGLYGDDAGPPAAPGANLASLLAQLGSIPGLGRVRLTSLEPETLGPELLEVLAGSAWLCPHVHLPVQSGDDALLARMGRPYRREDLRRIAATLARSGRGFALGLDLLAGFPGESERAFAATLALAEELPAAYLHVFPYSERPGTPAARLAGGIPPAERRARARALRDLDGRLRLRFQSRLRGRPCRVLVERVEGGRFQGLSAEYVRMRGTAVGVEPGELLEVVAGESLSPRLQSCRLICSGPPAPLPEIAAAVPAAGEPGSRWQD